MNFDSTVGDSKKKGVQQVSPTQPYFGGSFVPSILHQLSFVLKLACVEISDDRLDFMYGICWSDTTAHI
jgi:hypothetical protein